jgi:hypothetical protein
MTGAIMKIARAEQSGLLSLIKQRAKIAKADAVQRGAQLVANFETQLNTEYSFDQSAIWEAALRNASTVVTEANIRVREECDRLGIPAEFAPKIQMGWATQGQQASKERRADLRRLARVHIDAQVKHACAEIERSSVLVQTDLIASGMSEQANTFLSNMPTIEQMLPTVQVDTVKGLLASTKRGCLMSEY